MRNIWITIYFAVVMLSAWQARAGTPALTSPCTTAQAPAASPTEGEIAETMKRIGGKPAGERISFWAGRFVGTPYDADPLGAYVRCSQVVCDESVDCMYLVFRAAELGLSKTPQEARERALDLRFRTRGKIVSGKVANYDERFEYGEDMVFSGKWGRNVTLRIGRTASMPGSRGRATVEYLPRDVLLEPSSYDRLKDGDIIFFVKDPARRVVGEIVGHLGIVGVEGGRVSLIHASGSKASAGKPGGGQVKKVDLAGYVRDMKFVGVLVTRFDR